MTFSRKRPLVLSHFLGERTAYRCDEPLLRNRGHLIHPGHGTPRLQSADALQRAVPWRQTRPTSAQPRQPIGSGSDQVV